MINTQNIPKILKDRPQWVVWVKRERAGTDRFDKIPINPNNHSHNASTTDPTTWGKFTDALKALQTQQFNGLGFVFSKDDPFVGIDLDGCIHDGSTDMTAFERVMSFSSYTEVSPSGSGIHIICIGKIAKDIKTPHIEVYSSERFFTITGDVSVTKEVWDIRECQYELDQLMAELNVNKPIKIVKQLGSTLLDLEAPEGTRYPRSSKIAGYILAKLPQELWESTGWREFVHWCDTKCVPSLWKEQPTEVRKTWENIRDIHLASLAKQPDKKAITPRKLQDIGLEEVEDRRNEVVAPKTGFPELDSAVKGFLQGHIYTMTGNTNVGKTSIACNFVERIRRQKLPSLYFALEPDSTVVRYLASCRTQKGFDDLTDEDLTYDDDLVHVYKKIDVPDLNSLIEIVENSETHYSLIVIDHIGYFVTSQLNKTQEESNAVKRLALLAKQKKVAILIIAHLNKGATQRKSKALTMDDISGSAAFKQDSTEVFLINRQEDDNGVLSVQGMFHVAKTKRGASKKFYIYFSDRSAFVTSKEEVDLASIYRRNAPAKPQQVLAQDMANKEIVDLFNNLGGGEDK